MVATLRGVSKKFRVGVEEIVAVDDVDLSVEAGRLVCIYGASGSGKTTLLNILAGIDRPDSGEVIVTDRALAELSEEGRADLRLREIGVVFQSNNLLAELTALENVNLPLLVRGLSVADAEARATTSLTAVGLAQMLRRFPAQMSGGQRQRVGIARALAGGQRLIVADEPTGALDAERSRELFSLLRSACEERDAAVVLATHDPLAREFADSVHTMVDGAFVA